LIRFGWGDVEVSLLDAGSLWLDGGAMFGVVPKVLWQKEREPDDRNRIRLAMNVLLVDDGRQKTLIDTGAGVDWSDKERSIYGLETKSAAEMLEPAGVEPEQIDRVVNSHLHFDHAGGNTVRSEGGQPIAAFPNAEYVVQKRELETARLGNERIRASYLPDCFEPLAAEDRLREVEGEVTIGDAIQLIPAPGHTPGMQIVLVVSGEGTLAFMADLVPTASHLPYPYIMGFDLEPLVTLATKKRLLPRAASEGWQIVFEHDDRLPLARLHEESGRIAAVPAMEH
jgi:glyoxylase-like metal-dependent hydrolase (beta-lactamase superfamily II)